MRCERFFKTLLKQPAKTSLPAALFLLREGDGEDQLYCQFVVKMLSKPQMSAKSSPFKRTQGTKKARSLGLFEW